MDVFNFTATGNRHVLYIDAETPRESAANNIKQLGCGYKCNSDDIDTHFHLLTKNDLSISSLMDEEARSKVENQIKYIKSNLVIFDNLLTLSPEVIQAQAKWTLLSTWFKSLYTNYGTAVLFIHHTGKDGSSLGLQQIESTTNNIFKISKSSNKMPEKHGCIMTFEVTKNKKYPSLDGFKATYFLEAHTKNYELSTPWIKIEDEQFGNSIGTTSIGYIDDDSLSRDENKIMKLISEKGVVSRQDIQSLLNGCSDGTARNRLKLLIDKKLIDIRGRGPAIKYILRDQNIDTQGAQP
jgi:hypothetical protein